MNGPVEASTFRVNILTSNRPDDLQRQINALVNKDAGVGCGWAVTLYPPVEMEEGRLWYALVEGKYIL